VVSGDANTPAGILYIHRLALAIAIQACHSTGRPLRGKGVAGGQDFFPAWLGAAGGYMPAIGAQYHPAGFSFCVHG
jgi:hypothetical protein